MTKHLIISLLALLNICCASWAGEISVDQEQIIEADASSLESIFEVNKQIVSSKKGNLEVTKKDNQYILSALENINITLKGLNYNVGIFRKDYANAMSGAETNLVAFLYQVKFDNFKAASDKSLYPLKQKKYLKTYVSVTKAPVQCYAFLGSDSLNLLCHYGLQVPNKLPAIIKGLKANT